MVKSADSGYGQNSAHCRRTRFCPTYSGSSFAQSQVSPIFVVVVNVLFHQSPQMSFIQHDDMIEQISAAIANPAFGNAVLPRASEADPFWLKAKRLDCFDYFGVEVRGSVKDQILRRRVIGECFTQLRCDPCARWMAGEFPMQKAPSVVRNDEEAVQHSKGQGRDVKKSIAAIASR